MTTRSASTSAPEDRIPPTPASAATVFGDRVELAERYVHLLATTGIDHGLIGPREAPRLWERHVLNCAVVAECFPPSASVADLGAGAGLPGLVLAIARPDLHLHLIEPLHRRIVWLQDAIDALELSNVQLHESRAEGLHGALTVDLTTARAVARLDRLTSWSAGLLKPAGGHLVALKGSSAATERDEDWPAMRRSGAVASSIRELGAGVVQVPTTVVVVDITPVAPARGQRGGTSRGRPRRGGPRRDRS